MQFSWPGCSLVVLRDFSPSYEDNSVSQICRYHDFRGPNLESNPINFKNTKIAFGPFWPKWLLDIPSIFLKLWLEHAHIANRSKDGELAESVKPMGWPNLVRWILDPIWVSRTVRHHMVLMTLSKLSRLAAWRASVGYAHNMWVRVDGCQAVCSSIAWLIWLALPHVHGGACDVIRSPNVT